MSLSAFRSMVQDDARVVFATIAGERVITVSPRGTAAAANVLFVHGLGDYPARHIQTARRLAARGYRTVLVELAGHGAHASEWARAMAVYDLYASTPRSADMLRAFQSDAILSAVDLVTMRERQYARFENTDVAEHLVQIAAVLRHFDQATGDPRRLPLFLAGHSMGGLLVHEAARRMNDAGAALAGVILAAPALRPQGDPDRRLMQLAVDGVWALRRVPISPTRTAFKTLLGLNFGVDTSWGKKWVSDLPEEVDLYATDPLIPHRLPTRYASSIESLMAESTRRDASVPYDALVMVPRVDGITSRDAAVSFARRANAAGPARVDLRCFDVVAHDVLRSSARVQALSMIGDWMDGRLRARAEGTVEHRAS